MISGVFKAEVIGAELEDLNGLRIWKLCRTGILIRYRSTSDANETDQGLVNANVTIYVLRAIANSIEFYMA